MMNSRFKLSFTSDICKLKEMLDCILTCLKDEAPNLSDDELFKLRVIYSELIINAITHGNKQDPSKRVELIVSLNDYSVVSTIKDEGGGFDYAALFRPKNLMETVLEQGRGLQIVHSLTDYLHFNQTGNEIEFVKMV